MFIQIAAAIAISGVASVIDGDTLEIHGQRIRGVSGAPYEINHHDEPVALSPTAALTRTARCASQA